MLDHLAVDKAHAGIRLDLFLVRHFPGTLGRMGLSRSGVQRMLAEGQITLNGQKAKPSTRLRSDDSIEIQWMPPRDTGLLPEPISLDILHEDEDCLVVNKSAGMVIHPAGSRRSGTLVNALLHHCPDLQGIGGERRPGIVHRLDKDTSGAMVVAKHQQAFCHLALQFKERRVRKEYLALVWGLIDQEKGVIDRPIGRHRSDRKRMSSLYCLPRLREAITEWQVEDAFRLIFEEDRYAWITLLRLKPHSGRTHQLRVHLSDQGYPVVGDRIYGRKRDSFSRSPGGLSGLTDFPRHVLHAERLGFIHPRTGAAVDFHAPLPPDIKGLLNSLRERRSIDERKKLGKGG